MTITSHGLTSASQFLQLHLDMYVGRAVLSLGNNPIRGTINEFKVRLTSSYTTCHTVDLLSVTWNETGQVYSDFGTRTVEIKSILCSTKQLKRSVFVELSGHTDIPGIVTRDMKYCTVQQDVRDFFPPDSKIYNEYSRRWKIEAAATAVKAARKRLRVLKSQRPFVLD